MKYIYPKKSRVIAIGDIHGDFELLINCLLLAKVIKTKDSSSYKIKDYEWIGGETYVVQVGDQIDSCRPYNGFSCKNKKTTLKDKAEDTIILEFMNDLHDLAKKDKGAVISLLGNHELLNVQNRVDYVSYANLKTRHNDLFEPGKKYSKMLANTRATAIIIGPLLFVHGNMLQFNLKEMSEDKVSTLLEDINEIVKKWLLGEVKKENKLEGIGTVEEILNSFTISPFWSRVLGNLPPNLPINDSRCIEYMDKLKLYRVNNIIVGHTPQFDKNEGINSTCEERIWKIDTGSSKAFTNILNYKYRLNKNKKNSITDLRKPQVLEILIDKNDDIKFNVLK